MREGLVLVLGGARSGKSAYAERLIRESGLDAVYVATATSGDDEMAERIEEHRSRRGDKWRTVEAPDRLEDALARAAGEGRAVLVDCLTLWLTNIMLAGADIEARSRALAETASKIPGLRVFVSNEVGLGLVPETPLGRRFRDAQGRLNQAIAAAADQVVFT
jgi:adenosylcobinamide kinase / adenosylcobinamide-phosphate guanylyltransferase